MWVFSQVSKRTCSCIFCIFLGLWILRPLISFKPCITGRKQVITLIYYIMALFKDFLLLLKAVKLSCRRKLNMSCFQMLTSNPDRGFWKSSPARMEWLLGCGGMGDKQKQGLYRWVGRARLAVWSVLRSDEIRKTCPAHGTGAGCLLERPLFQEDFSLQNKKWKLEVDNKTEAQGLMWPH